MEFYLFIFFFLENILPCVIEDWKCKSVAEDQRAECPDRKHAVHYTSTDLLNRVKVNEADQLFQAYIKFPDHSNAHWSFGDLNVCVIPTDQSGFCPWVRHGDKYFLKDIREDWQDHTGAFRKLHFRTYNTNMYMNNYIY